MKYELQYQPIDDDELIQACEKDEANTFLSDAGTYESFYQPIGIADKELFQACAIDDMEDNTHQKDHKRNLVQIRKVDRLDDFIFRSELSDLFWPIDVWPQYAVKVLFSKRFSYQERLVFATFLHGNGLQDTSFAVKILKTYNCNVKFNSIPNQNAKIKKFVDLFNYLDKSNNVEDPQYHHIQNTYYYYDMRLKLMVFYSGDLRKGRTE